MKVKRIKSVLILALLILNISVEFSLEIQKLNGIKGKGEIFLAKSISGNVQQEEEDDSEEFDSEECKNCCLRCISPDPCHGKIPCPYLRLASELYCREGCSANCCYCCPIEGKCKSQWTHKLETCPLPV